MPELGQVPHGQQRAEAVIGTHPVHRQRERPRQPPLDQHRRHGEISFLHGLQYPAAAVLGGRPHALLLRARTIDSDRLAPTILTVCQRVPTFDNTAALGVRTTSRHPAIAAVVGQGALVNKTITAGLCALGLLLAAGPAPR